MKNGLKADENFYKSYFILNFYFKITYSSGEKVPYWKLDAEGIKLGPAFGDWEALQLLQTSLRPLPVTPREMLSTPLTPPVGYNDISSDDVSNPFHEF